MGNDGWSFSLANQTLDFIQNHFNDSFVIIVYSKVRLHDINSFWQTFASLVLNQKFLSVNKGKSAIKRFHFQYNINMRKSKMKSCEVVTFIARCLQKKLFDTKAIHLVKKHLCKSLIIE